LLIPFLNSLKYGPGVIVRKQKAKNKEFFTYFIDGINV